jgi:hypothetical protein
MHKFTHHTVVLLPHTVLPVILTHTDAITVETSRI